MAEWCFTKREGPEFFMGLCVTLSDLQGTPYKYSTTLIFQVVRDVYQRLKAQDTSIVNSRLNTEYNNGTLNPFLNELKGLEL